MRITFHLLSLCTDGLMWLVSRMCHSIVCLAELVSSTLSARKRRFFFYPFHTPVSIRFHLFTWSSSNSYIRPFRMQICSASTLFPTLSFRRLCAADSIRLSKFDYSNGPPSAPPLHTRLHPFDLASSSSSSCLLPTNRLHNLFDVLLSLNWFRRLRIPQAFPFFAFFLSFFFFIFFHFFQNSKKSL